MGCRWFNGSWRQDSEGMALALARNCSGELYYRNAAKAGVQFDESIFSIR